MSARYRPGDAAVLVGEHGLVVTDREHATALGPLAGAELVVLSVIDSLSGGVLASLPHFACVTSDGRDLRIVVRGAITVAVGDQTWGGEDVATWREHVLPGAASSEVTVSAGGADAGDQLELPLAAGVVLASQVTWTAVPAPRPATATSAPAPAPVRPPAPARVPATPPPPPVPPAPPARPAPTAPPAPAGPPPPPPAVAPATTPRPAPAAAPAPEPEPTLALAPLGDHDGRTITAAQLRQLRERAAGGAPAPRAAVVLPSGERHAVAPRLVIGRRPQAREVATADVPTLVTVDDPYVSGTHLEVVLHDRELAVTDVSTNGTLVILPGQQPARLEKGVPTPVPDGTRLSLSEGLTVTIELGAGG